MPIAVGQTAAHCLDHARATVVRGTAPDRDDKFGKTCIKGFDDQLPDPISRSTTDITLSLCQPGQTGGIGHLDHCRGAVSKRPPICIYLPAQGGSAKDWTHFAVSNPRVRLKIGDKVYPAIATRITGPDAREAMVAAARAKYGFDGGDTPPEDIWLFRMDCDAVDVAAAP